MVDAVTLVAWVLVAFAGGVFGAAIGGLQAFGIAGLVIVVGEAANLARESAAAVGPPPPGAADAFGLTTSVGYGPALGPHVALAGGVGAAAYAARSGHLDTDFRYHDAKNVGTAIGTAPPVLLVGGSFGVVGLLLARGSLALGLPWDPVMFAVVGSALVHRLAFGYPLIGDLRSDVLDMSPFERGERRQPMTERHGEARPDGGTETRYVVEPWLPQMYEWPGVALVGTAVGALSGYVTWVTGSAFLPFGLTAATVLVLTLGDENVPLTHHMALPASLAVVGLAGGADPAILDAGVTGAELAATMAPWVAVLVGAVFGLVAGLAGELAQRVLYAHADTYLDPAAVAIVVGTFLVALLDVLGVFAQSPVPTLGA